MTSTELGVAGPPAWPGCALGAWAASWRAGRSAPDDVTDTLAEFAARHEIVDPARLLDDVTTRGAHLDLLALLRRTACLEVRLPTAGDPQGLPPDPATTAALTAGEILLLHEGTGTSTLGLVPALDDDVCRWTVHRYDRAVAQLQPEPLGQVEYDLREAIRETADIIGRLGSSGMRVSPGELRATLGALTARHQVILPPHDTQRATRIIDSAAQVEAIVTIAGAQAPTYGVTAGHSDAGDTNLRRLAALARGARAAAVNTVIGEFQR